MIHEQTFIGAMVAALCALLLWNEKWFLDTTNKGRWLVRKFGPSTGPWVLRALIVLGILFGVLLALDVIRPVQWDAK